MDYEFPPDKLLIRATGNWNPKIFTPGWIKKNLVTPESTEAFNFLFNPGEIEIGYDVQGIKIFPKLNELAIAIDKDNINDVKVLLCNKFLLKILELLPQTPIKAVGFNVNYLIDRNQETKITSWYESQKQYFEDLSLNQVSVTKNFDKYILNIIINPEDEKLKINFNYHFSYSIDENPSLYIDLIRDTRRYL